MSSVPIDRAPPARAAADHGNWLKMLLPRTLFGRSLLIMVTPVVLLQVVATFIFFERHWNELSRRLADSVASEVAMVLEQLETATNDEARAQLVALSARTLDLYFGWQPDVILPNAALAKDLSLVEARLSEALDARTHRPHRLAVNTSTELVRVELQMPTGVVLVDVPLRRLFSPTTYIFILWMAGTSLVLFAVAIIFMRNQIRPIRRLAEAADRFGKGLDAPGFRVEGATEVRLASVAFLRMRERIRRQIAQRTEMLAGVSHDLRTPLTRMKLELALLGDVSGVADLRDDVDEMQRMIDGYLAFARGEGTEEPDVVDIAVLVEDAVNNIRRQGARIIASIETQAILTIKPDAMRRCLSNLLTNAAKYAHQTTVMVRERGNFIEISVDDDGPGIPSAQREEVFRPFARLDASRNSETGGVGLGLTIARDIARGHGGDIVLDQSPQGGLRAVLRLPK
jgi:two-component system, OmpR family, osmolarity sensor histidine kinase EnvZ